VRCGADECQALENGAATSLGRRWHA